MIGTRVTSSRAALLGLGFDALHRRHHSARGRRQQGSEDRLRRGDQRPCRRLGHFKRAIDADARGLVELKRRRQDRRRHLRHQRRDLRRPEGPEAGHRRHGEDGAGRHPLCRWPERRRRCGRRAPGRGKLGIIYFPYAFPKELYTKPASNAVLGMVANYQSAPAIYKYLKDNRGVKTIAFVAANEFGSAESTRWRRGRRQGAGAHGGCR